MGTKSQVRSTLQQQSAVPGRHHGGVAYWRNGPNTFNQCLGTVVSSVATGAKSQARAMCA